MDGIRLIQPIFQSVFQSVFRSEQAADNAVLVDIDSLSRRNLGKSGHGHDVTSGQGNDEPAPALTLEVAHGDGKALGSAQQSRIVGEGEPGLGHADGKSREAEVCQLLDLLDGIADQLNAVCVIDLSADHVELLLR